MIVDSATVKHVVERPSWLPDTVWPFEPCAVEIDGDLVHYVDVGTGPTLLLVHAGMWTFVWRDTIARLRADFRCVALDFPGFGLSAVRPGPDPTVEGNARLLEAFVDRLRLEQLTLVGHDLGGLAVLGLAARRPDLVRGLVLVQTFGWKPDRRPLRAMLRLMGSAPMRELGALTNLVPRLTATRFGVGRHLDSPERRAFLGPFRDRRTRRAFNRLMASVGESDALFREIGTALTTTLADRPALAVFGERNDPFGFQQRWQSIFPHARTVIVPGGHHFPMCDDPDLFADAIRSWWRSEIAGAEAGR